MATAVCFGVCHWRFQAETWELPSWLSPDVPCPTSCLAPGAHRYDVLRLAASGFWDRPIKRLYLMAAVTRYGEI